MRSIFLSLSGLLLSYMIFGQKIAVKNTGVSMVPPPGFVKSDLYNGFQNEKSEASIIVLELPGPLKEVTAGFNVEMMSRQGIDLQKTERIKLSKDSATIYYVMQKDSVGNTYYKQILVLGDDKHTVMVNGIYPSTSQTISKALHQSLLTVSYKATTTLPAIPFEVNANGLGFILTSAINNSLVYTRDGEIPTKSLDKATFIVARSLTDVSISDHHEFSLRRLRQLPKGEALEVKTINDIMIDSLKGVEIIATSAEMEFTYQCILFMDKGYYILFSSSKEYSPESIATAQRIAYTFKRKK